MKRVIIVSLLGMAVMLISLPVTGQAQNTLSDKEKKRGMDLIV